MTGGKPAVPTCCVVLVGRCASLVTVCRAALHSMGTGALLTRCESRLWFQRQVSAGRQDEGWKTTFPTVLWAASFLMDSTNRKHQDSD